ncbi:MAG: serine/threonine protein kinase [Actinomycetota bacterium]|nr:serine/threonine protein kinase [Actinomycetota bacterium]
MRSEPAAAFTMGRYAVGDVLGRGGMGEVRAARDLRLERDVAIKLLTPELAALPTTRARFEREAQAAARLNHPNVVLVYDSGEHEGIPFLVMERLPGRTLADELAQGPLPIERTRRVAVEILAALAAAHRAGIVHRDVKPANVLLAPDGHVKVGDFGIAKTVEGVDVTTTGVLLGTPAYLSPEQVAGEAATARSDIYAVGVLLYEALTGRKPFAAASPLALAQAIHHQPPTPIGELRPDTPPDLAWAVAKAMDKDPQRRFASAEQMTAALVGSAPSDASHVQPTGQLASTEAFGSRTQQAAWRTDERIGPHARHAKHRGPGWRVALVVAAILAVAIVVALAVGSTGDSPDQAPEVSVTTTPTGAVPGWVPPELDRALQGLEEAVRP